MLENVPFYSAGKTPADIVGNSETSSCLKQYSWRAVREYAAQYQLKGFYIDLRPIGYFRSNRMKNITIEEIPEEFLTIPDELDDFHMYITSVNYIESGPFHTSELAFRAYKRLFSWDMYVLCTPGIYFTHARERSLMREILEKYYPLESGDTGPAGGIIIKDSDNKLIEVSPVDAGFCSWNDADRLCNEFSHNGYDKWRLPSAEELKTFAYALRSRLQKREKIYNTTETAVHWSRQQKGGKAVAVVTSENEDHYVFPYSLSYMTGTSGGYWTSKNGPWRGSEKELPVTDWLPVRPVRDVILTKNA